MQNPYYYKGGNLVVVLLDYEFGPTSNPVTVNNPAGDYRAHLETFMEGSVSNGMAQLTRSGANTLDFPDFGSPTFGDVGEYSNIRKSMRLGVEPLTPAIMQNELQLVTTIHPSLQSVAVGQQDAQILRVAINMRGNLNVQSINTINFDAKQTTTTQVTAAKLYYTENDGDFVNPTLLNTAAQVGGMYNFSFTNIELPHGTHYFWLIYDISPNCPNGSFVDASLNSIFLGGVTYD
jgi:hypothetical protein